MLPDSAKKGKMPPNSIEAYELHAQEFLRRRDQSLVGSRVVSVRQRHIDRALQLLDERLEQAHHRVDRILACRGN